MSCIQDFLLRDNNILIDRFKRSDLCTDAVTDIFLTHFHTDHTVGLSVRLLSTGLIRVHCSLVTKRLLENEYGSFDCIIPYKVDMIYRLNDDVKFKFFDANHSPGSVMIYFNILETKVMYTGDFRLCDDFESKFDDIIVDRLYYDESITTRDFNPVSYDDTATALKTFIDEHGGVIYINMSTLGFEQVLGKLDLIFSLDDRVSSVRKKHIHTLIPKKIVPKHRLILSHRKYRLEGETWIDPGMLFLLCSDEHIICTRTTKSYDYDPNRVEYKSSDKHNNHLIYKDVNGVYKLLYCTHPSMSEVNDIARVTQAKEVIPCGNILSRTKNK